VANKFTEVLLYVNLKGDICFSFHLKLTIKAFQSFSFRSELLFFNVKIDVKKLFSLYIKMNKRK